jgi:hypothetical protein
VSRRIYRVSSARTGDEWLVRAHNQAQAIRHVVKSEYRAAVAGQETLIELLTTGAKVLDTDDEPELELDDEPREVEA